MIILFVSRLLCSVSTKGLNKYAEFRLSGSALHSHSSGKSSHYPNTPGLTGKSAVCLCPQYWEKYYFPECNFLPTVPGVGTVGLQMDFFSPNLHQFHDICKK